MSGVAFHGLFQGDKETNSAAWAARSMRASASLRDF
jgi:hypothetical protein